ncbi:MAG: hypothetical protein FJ279_14700 [Planctomycetes bacterium]|nr:hypothetical protein [Planctomycetota bacterium]
MRKPSLAAKCVIVGLSCFSVACLLLTRNLPFLHASPPEGEVAPLAVPIHLLNNLCGCGNPDCDGTLTYCAGMGCPCDWGGPEPCGCGSGGCLGTGCGPCPTDPCLCLLGGCIRCNAMECFARLDRCFGAPANCATQSGCLGALLGRCFCASYCPKEDPPCYQATLPPIRLERCGCQGAGCVSPPICLCLLGECGSAGCPECDPCTEPEPGTTITCDKYCGNRPCGGVLKACAIEGCGLGADYCGCGGYCPAASHPCGQ